MILHPYLTGNKQEGLYTRRPHQDPTAKALRKVSPSARHLWFGLCNCRSETPGLIEIPWAVEPASVEELEEVLLIVADWRARYLWVPKRFFDSPPTTPAAVARWEKALRPCDSGIVKYTALQSLSVVTSSLADLAQAFETHLGVMWRTEREHRWAEAAQGVST